MALEYVVTKGVFGFDKDKNEKDVAKSVCSGRVSSSKMCGKVSHLCGVHRKVVDLFVSGLVDMSITRHTELETDYTNGGGSGKPATGGDGGKDDGEEVPVPDSTV